jgi:elongation factor 1-alpha
MNVKGLPKDNMPRVGDIMVLTSDDTCSRTASFGAQIQVLNHPGELKPGYTPIAFVRTGRSAVKMTEINWKVGKSTGGAKVEGAPMIKAGEMGLVTFEPQQPFVVEPFKVCEGLGRLAIMEGNSVVMLGKAVKTTAYVDK